jgi:hypothetical protein
MILRLGPDGEPDGLFEDAPKTLSHRPSPATRPTKGRPKSAGEPPNPIAKARVAWLNPLSFDKLFRAVTNIVGRVL